MKLKALTLAFTSLLLLTSCQAVNSNSAQSTWVNGACTAANPGVTLSIDYLGKVNTHCAPRFKGNGWELFKAAGFRVVGTDKYPNAFACTINELPQKADCSGNDNSGAYWGYFVATDGKWGYATTGAADHVATCGESEGWVYMKTQDTVSHLPTPVTFSCKG